MKRLNKSKKGFTLIEMVLVIAIIVILSVVMIFQVSDYLNRAHSATSVMEAHNEAVSSVMSDIEANT